MGNKLRDSYKMIEHEPFSSVLGECTILILLGDTGPIFPQSMGRRKSLGSKCDI